MRPLYAAAYPPAPSPTQHPILFNTWIIGLIFDSVRSGGILTAYLGTKLPPLKVVAKLHTVTAYAIV